MIFFTIINVPRLVITNTDFSPQPKLPYILIIFSRLTYQKLSFLTLVSNYPLNIRSLHIFALKLIISSSECEDFAVKSLPLWLLPASSYCFVNERKYVKKNILPDFFLYDYIGKRKNFVRIQKHMETSILFSLPK